MKYYRVNRDTSSNPNGNNEVHNDSCIHYARLVSFESLGQHSTCYSAVVEAKKRGYHKADGCAKCSEACNNG